MNQKQLMPDAPASGGGETVKSTPVKTRLQPRKDADIGTLATSNVAAWAAEPTLTLKWITQKEYDTVAIRYNTNLAARLSAGGDRPGKTISLKKANEAIDKGESSVKKYIGKKYEDDQEQAKAQYAKFGMAKVGSTYTVPSDGDKRKLALPLMLAGVAAEGFGAEKYGTAFWTQTIADYNAALGATTDTTKKITETVSDKDTDKTLIMKVQKALPMLLEANFPDTFDAVLRQWGYLRENY